MLKSWLLQAVHCGEDLGASIGSVLGYRQESVKGKPIDIPLVPGISQRLKSLLKRLQPKANREDGDERASKSERAPKREVNFRAKAC